MLVAFVEFTCRRGKPQGLECRTFGLLNSRQFDLGSFGFWFDRPRCGLASRMGFSQRFADSHGAVGRTNRSDGVAVLVRAKACKAPIKLDLAAVVAPQVKHRIPATRHGDEITIDFLFADDPALAFAIGSDFYSPNRQCSFNS